MSNRKPFNLEEALAGKPVVTRGGTRVDRVVSFVGVLTSTEFSVMFCAEGAIYSCKADGKMYTGHGDGPRDLFMEVEDEVIWVNVYHKEEGIPVTLTFTNKEAADAKATFYNAIRVNNKAYKLTLN